MNVKHIKVGAAHWYSAYYEPQRGGGGAVEAVEIGRGATLKNFFIQKMGLGYGVWGLGVWGRQNNEG